MTSPPPQRPPYLALTLLLLYPLLLLLAHMLGRSWISALAAVDLVSLLLLGGLRNGNRLAWACWTVAVAGTLWLLQQRQAEIVLLLVPVFINAGMAWFFGRTLLPGRRPLGRAARASSVVAAVRPEITVGERVIASKNFRRALAILLERVAGAGEQTSAKREHD